MVRAADMPNLSFRLRSSASTATGSPPGMPHHAAMPGSAQRRKGLYVSSAWARQNHASLCPSLLLSPGCQVLSVLPASQAKQEVGRTPIVEGMVGRSFALCCCAHSSLSVTALLPESAGTSAV